MGTNDCGIVGVTALDSLRLRVTFAPDGGAAVPLEADAINPGNYLVDMLDDHGLVAVMAEQVSALEYDLTLQHRMEPPGAAVSVNTAAIGTDLGGYCDSPEIEDGIAMADPQTRGQLGMGNDPNAWTLGPMTPDGEPLYVGTVPRSGKPRRRVS